MAAPNPLPITFLVPCDVPVGRQRTRTALDRGRQRTRSVATWLRLWLRTVVTRSELAEIEDRMLADLGISRAQAAFELSRAPWSVHKPGSQPGKTRGSTSPHPHDF